jgi:hypoxanthine phosphoribosyltransferase
MPIISRQPKRIYANQGHRVLKGSQFSDWMIDLKDKLQPYCGCFDTIVCRGKSGMLAAGYLAASLTKNIVIIRKSTANSHATGLVEYWEYPNSYIIVDDFISSGATMMNITRKMKKLFPGTELVAIALYDDYDRDVESDFVLSKNKKVQKLWDTVTVFTPSLVHNAELLHLKNKSNSVKH